MPEVLGLDIGGANLKAATSGGEAVTLPFPLWKQPDKLVGGLLELQVRLRHRGPVAVTMTGELCDCFVNKTAGVRHILGAVEEVFAEHSVFVWRNDGKWASVKHALDEPLPVAAANWLASATYAARYLPTGSGWFFDLGSTTFDMIPLVQGKVVTSSKTDLNRLQSGELAYLGANRTPVCNLVHRVELNGASVTVAAEWFATIDDVLLLLDLTDEDSHDKNTADHQPRTKAHASARLARMVCADVEELGPVGLQQICQQVMHAYRDRLAQHLRWCHTRRHQDGTSAWGGVILAGSGETLLAQEIAAVDSDTSPVVSMTGRVGPTLSTALAAYSVAILLAERQTR